MFTRRELIKRSLASTSLLSLGTVVPQFIASTATAGERGSDRILVVLEMTGGNDGLNTVIPYGDDLYHKARPTLHLDKSEVLAMDDYVGLNPSLSGLHQMFEKEQLAVVQGVGYPNPNRSHFESMDIWHSADPQGSVRSGWLGRAIGDVKVPRGRVPAFHLGQNPLPLALQGAATTVPSLNTEKPFGLDLIDGFYGHQPDGESNETNGSPPVDASDKALREKKRRAEDLAQLAPSTDDGLLSFVRRTSLDTYTTLDQLKEIMDEDFAVPDAQSDFSQGRYQQLRSGPMYELLLISRMIRAGFGTRIFYLSFSGFDTHSQQRNNHNELLQTTGDAVQSFFRELEQSGDAERVLLLTFSEFGRRVAENGSKGTDHGSGSCLFVAGPGVKAGLVGKHPSLAPDDLDRGDLKYHTDFRQVYATLLDNWLDVNSRAVLGAQFAHIPVLPNI